MPGSSATLPGRDQAVSVTQTHFVNGHPLKEPFPAGLQRAVFGLGCFWGAERLFWETAGVYTTAVGYSGGQTRNANYREVCSGKTGHAEAVLIVFDPAEINYEKLLRLFWENHDPTQGMRQGNDIGTQYRSVIFAIGDNQLQAARDSQTEYQQELTKSGYGAITTEIVPAGDFYYAEDYHQQYLAKNPGSYCGIGGTGVSCPVGQDFATPAA